MNESAPSPSPESHTSMAEAYESIRGGLNQLVAHFISTRTAAPTRSDELDRRERLLEEKEASFRSKESKLEAIDEAITEKLLDFEERKRDLEGIEDLIRVKEEEIDSLRNREREVNERLRSKEESGNVSVEKVEFLAKNVECVNEAKRREREVEMRERWVEELRNNVELKEKGLREMEKKLVEEHKRAMDTVIKAAEEGAMELEDSARSLRLRGEELNRKEMELREREEALKMKERELRKQDEAFGLKRCRMLEHAPGANNAISDTTAKQPESSISDKAASLLPLVLEPTSGNNFKQNAHQNMDAIYLALEWKEKMMGDTRNSVEGFAFLLFLATYGILNSLDIDEIVKLLGLVSQNNRALELCQTPALAVGITDLVRDLIENKRLHEAVKYVGMFKLSDKIPIEPVLKKYVQEAMKYFAETCGLRITPDEKVKVIENQIADARALLQCVKDHNSGSKTSSNDIEIQIALLEKLKAQWRSLLPDVCSDNLGQQEQRKRKNHGGSTPVTETLSQQPRKVKIICHGPET